MGGAFKYDGYFGRGNASRKHVCYLPSDLHDCLRAIKATKERGTRSIVTTNTDRLKKRLGERVHAGSISSYLFSNWNLFPVPKARYFFPSCCVYAPALKYSLRSHTVSLPSFLIEWSFLQIVQIIERVYQTYLLGTNLSILIGNWFPSIIRAAGCA